MYAREDRYVPQASYRPRQRPVEAQLRDWDPIQLQRLLGLILWASLIAVLFAFGAQA